MPISDIQDEILRRIASNRNPESYLAGATVLHRAEDSPRFSQDLDFFHDVEDSVAVCAERDSVTLCQAGYDFAWLLRTPTFHRAIVTAGGRPLKLEWAQDSVFRFFPVQKDERCGYRLHVADAAVNKLLALAGRNEIRDFVDVLHLHATYLSLGALAWAACGKDPGFTPELLLDHAGRHTAFTQSDLDRLRLRVPLDFRSMKQSWFAALDEAQKVIATFPPEELGCLYLGRDHAPLTPDVSSAGFRAVIRHMGSIRGAWPTVSAYRSANP